MKKLTHSKQHMFVVLLVTALATLLLRTGITHALALQSCGMWSIVPSPNPAGGSGFQLNAVAASSDRDVWAVGEYTDKHGISTPLIEHWGGKQWRIVKSANPANGTVYLRGAAVISKTDAWAVGYTQDVGAFTEHWDGMQWSLVAPANPGQNNGLLAVAAVSSTDVWATGYVSPSYGVFYPLVEHWDGTQWSIAKSPTAGGLLYGIAAHSANDIWAVGSANIHGGDSNVLTEHWNGKRWSYVVSPNPNPNAVVNELTGASFASGQTVWAVGSSILDTGFQVFSERWDGKQWNIVANPNPDQNNELLAVAALSATDIWAVGYHWNSNDDIDHTLIEHWDGTQWSIVPGQDAGSSTLWGVAVSSKKQGDLWAVGAGSSSGTLTEFYC